MPDASITRSTPPFPGPFPRPDVTFDVTVGGASPTGHGPGPGHPATEDRQARR
ncbi:hypothetical protein [Streptosporangium sp. NPDC002721]|uniref:hypothetical protein n=1 Tax=Streptosporangium sp. NPDC002721 TaxID=3366188 RepID=UPI0036A0C232